MLCYCLVKWAFFVTCKPLKVLARINKSYKERKRQMDRQEDVNKNVEIQKTKPTHIAQRCPVCNGFGTLKYGSKICQGCKGKGYVLVPIKEEVE